MLYMCRAFSGAVRRQIVLKLSIKFLQVLLEHDELTKLPLVRLRTFL